MVELHKLANENEEQYIWRLGQAKDNGLLDLNWDELADIINKECRDDESEYRTGSAYRKPYSSAKRFFDAGVCSKNITAEPYLEAIRVEKIELQKERQKFRDEKLEYNRWLREEARDELITERLCEAVRDLTPIEQVGIPLMSYSNVDTIGSGILLFGDTHYGSEYEIKGINGDIINKYNPEIFEERMNEMLKQTVDIVRKENLNKVKVFSLGDEIDGILRVSQLRKLRYGIVESTIKYADFISTWLNELTKYVEVEFQMVAGNHSELRLINQPKGTFVDDNMSEIIRRFIEIRLENNPHFTMVKNKSGLIYDAVEGFNVLGIHGEVKNLSQAIMTFSNNYKSHIDILVGGHTHHLKTETVGVNRDVVSIPSIIGIDDFSMSIGKTSNAGATFIIIEEHKGITQQYNIKFNI
jgi:predicted phosphodiesterase